LFFADAVHEGPKAPAFPVIGPCISDPGGMSGFDPANGFIESAVNEIIAKRMVKKQQMVRRDKPA
jgi:hypothetical protein